MYPISKFIHKMNYAKDGITVAAMLDTGHPKKNGLYPVRIRVTYARDRRYYPTGKDMTPEEWNVLPTSKARLAVAVRKDIENSYQLYGLPSKSWLRRAASHSMLSTVG